MGVMGQGRADQRRPRGYRAKKCADGRRGFFVFYEEKSSFFGRKAVTAPEKVKKKTDGQAISRNTAMLEVV